MNQAARNGVVSTFDMNNPEMVANKLTYPIQELEHNLYSLSMNLTHGSNGPELPMQAAANTNLWHWPLGRLNRKSLDLLKNLDSNWMSFDGPVPDCDVSAVGKSHQLPHPKTADYKVKLSFQLVFAYLMGPLTPEALAGYTYTTRFLTTAPSGRRLIG